MDKNTFIGITSDDKACILYSIATFDMLSKQIDCIEASDFIHRATNWCGKDEINRTLSLNSYILTGREITLQHQIVFTGIDNDMGHEYEWSINVVKIAEVKELKV